MILLFISKGGELMRVQNVPKATLGRLPGYLKYLKEIEKESKTVSATTISKALCLGEVQVRKDLGAVSGEGKPKIGYVTEELIDKLEECLGQKDRHRAVIVGAGKLGRALLDYEGFSDYGLEIAAAFDIKIVNEEKSDAGKPLYPMSEFADFCAKNDVRIGIVTVPKAAAQEVADLMVENNISAIWSFAPIAIKVPENVPVEHENLALSLAHLSKQI